MYCRVLNWMSTEVSEVCAAYIIRAMSEPSQVKVTLQLTVSQPVRLGVEPLLGLMTRFYFVTGLAVTVLCLVGYPI
jgi:hypothetical protein